MLGTLRLQEWIHRLEEGKGARVVRWFLTVMAFGLLALLYDVYCFRNLNNAEAMDAAQLGRNIAEGRGFTTSCVRPLSMTLVGRRQPDKSALLKQGHPDISNPPVYPCLLAGLLKVAPGKQDLAAIKNFNVVPADLTIAIVNQLLLGLGAMLVFRMAREWFNRPAAWMSAVLFVFTEQYWRFSVSGLSTILLIDLVLVLFWLLGAFERGQRENASSGRMLACAAGAGLIAAMAMLTRYSAGWLLLPVLLFLGWAGASRRFASLLAALLAFLIVVTPWLVRNVFVCGVPFGTQTFVVLQDTKYFPADTLERSLKPAMAGLSAQKWDVVVAVTRKLTENSRDLLVNELPRFGGNWMWSFFLAGLMVRFQSPGLNRARWLCVWMFVVLGVAQVLGRTHLSSEVPGINSENLLVLVSPVVIIFGAGFFFVLFDSLPLPTLVWRLAGLSGFVLLISLPLLLAFFPPRPRAFAAPYYPPRMQQVAQYLKDGELLMTDVPWATAWYGRRQSVWIPLSWQEDFYRISDFEKSVHGLYVSARTTDTRFFSAWYAGENKGWGQFLLQCFLRAEVPPGFPLKHSPERLLSSGELLLMDRDRWSMQSP